MIAIILLRALWRHWAEGRQWDCAGACHDPLEFHAAERKVEELEIRLAALGVETDVVGRDRRHLMRVVSQRLRGDEEASEGV